jgi:hypothetical protein
MWIYFLCFLAGIGLFYGLPRAFRALGIRKVTLAIGAEFYSPQEESVKKLEKEYENRKELDK